jgi:hypothetical protein
MAAVSLTCWIFSASFKGVAVPGTVLGSSLLAGGMLDVSSLPWLVFRFRLKTVKRLILASIYLSRNISTGKEVVRDMLELKYLRAPCVLGLARKT